MRTNVVLALILIIILGVLNVFQYQQNTFLSTEIASLQSRVSSLAEDCPITIAQLKGSERDNYIGKTVTVEGYLYGIEDALSFFMV